MADAARKFIDALPAQDKIALVAFTRRYRALSDFTTDKESLKKVVEQIKGFDGGTAFYDSMWQALDQLDPNPDARKAIVVLTDGEDESLIGDKETTRTFDELLDRASEERDDLPHLFQWPEPLRQGRTAFRRRRRTDERQ